MILVKYPSRSRPERFLQVLKEWVRLADDTSGLHFVFSFDADDDSMWEAGEWIRDLGINANVYFRTSNTKVEAINRDIADVTVPWEILVVVSDDMWPQVQGWDTLIRGEIAATDGDCLVWHPDQKQKDIVTLPIMTRAYYDRDGHVYDPRFTSVFCDNLQTDLARKRGRLVFIDTLLAEHRHPANVTMSKDALYEKNETPEIWKQDQALFERLKKEIQA